MNENEIKTEEKSLDTNYLNKINELEDKLSKSVSIEKYNKAIDDNATLLNALTENRQVQTQTSEKTKYTQEDVDRFAKAVIESQSNMEVIQNSLNYRDAVLDVYGKDVFVPQGNKIEKDRKGKYHISEDEEAATQNDYAIAENAAKCYKYALEESNGSKKQFNRIIEDIMR